MKNLWGWMAIIVVIVGGYFVFKKGDSASAETIKIGFVGPFTGPVAGSSGEDVGNGWKLAVAERPEIAGKEVEVIYEDDACDPKQAASAAQKLVVVDKVSIVINGVCSGSMLAMAPITEEAGAILFTPVSTSPKITDAGDHVFRTSASSVSTARAMSAFLGKADHKKIAILFENADYTVGLKDAFVADFESVAGNAIMAAEGVNSKDYDVRTQLTKLAALKPQVMVAVMNSTVTANAFVKQSREFGLKIPVLGNEYFGFREVVENPDADGFYITQYAYDPASPAFAGYLERYEAAYGKKPSQEIYAAQPFDGYNVLADAIEKCGNTEADCVRDALYATKEYQGITGVITIDQNGDSDRAFTIRKITKGVLTDI